MAGAEEAIIIHTAQGRWGCFFLNVFVLDVVQQQVNNNQKTQSFVTEGRLRHTRRKPKGYYGVEPYYSGKRGVQHTTPGFVFLDVVFFFLFTFFFTLFREESNEENHVNWKIPFLFSISPTPFSLFGHFNVCWTGGKSGEVTGQQTHCVRIFRQPTFAFFSLE